MPPRNDSRAAQTPGKENAMAMNRELIGRSYPPSSYEVKEAAMIKKG